MSYFCRENPNRNDQTNALPIRSGHSGYGGSLPCGGFLLDIPDYKLDMLLDLRRRGFRLFMLSNTNTIMMTYMKNGVFRKQGLTIDAYFDRLFLSYEMGLVKPGAEIFRRMIESSGIVPSQTLFIDDSQANVDTGKACGFDTYLAARNEDFRPLFDRIEPSV